MYTNLFLLIHITGTVAFSPRQLIWRLSSVRLSHRTMAAMSSADGSVQGLGDIGGVAAAVDNGNGESDIVPWKARIQRSSAISRKVRGGNYVQIATVDADGKPRCRTVVFRGFFEPPEVMCGYGGAAAMRMITDARSEKVGQGLAQPACEMVWWFSKSSEQYRITGDLQFIGPEQVNNEAPTNHVAEMLERKLQIARKSQWGNLSDTAREQFYWRQPGANRSEAAAGCPPPGGRDAHGNILPPPDTFLLMLLWPKSVRYLRLTDNFAQVDEVVGATWIPRRVNP
jgi:pyridoxamine 5'-phosphate oxidase